MQEVRDTGTSNNAFDIEESDHSTQKQNIETYETDFNIETETSQIENPKKKSLLSHKKQQLLKTGLIYLLHIVVVGYFAYATYHHIDIELNQCDGVLEKHPLCGIKFCSGYGFLVLFLGFIYLGLFYYFIFKPKVGKHLHKKFMVPFGKRVKIWCRNEFIKIGLLAIFLILLCGFLYWETRKEPRKLISLVAPCLFILLGYIFSTNRKAINWTTVLSGIFFQFLLGVICIRWEVGRNIFQCIGNKVADFLHFTDEGSIFVYGKLLIEESVFAFAILPVIFFFSFFISILYYIGAMQWVVMKLGWGLQQILGTTVCESVIAAANIFLGMSESPLLIRPYIKLLTSSEMHTIMVSGFATVSGTVLAAYLSFGANAAHLITSSVMAAPAALAISKLYMPETEESKTTSDNIQLEKSEDSSLLDAATNGASNAIPIVMGIIANIVAFISFVAFLNAVVNWFGVLVGLNDIDFEWIFSKLFIPLAWTMGVPFKYCDIVAKVIATKTIINEFVAYQRLGEYIKSGALDGRSAGIATFAICGFANPSSLGILIGSLSVMAPSRRALITSVAIRAFIVGSIVCFVSASFAGILMQTEEENQTYQKILKVLGQENLTLPDYY